MISNRIQMSVLVLLVSIFSLSGCSVNKTFVLKDAKSIGPLKVVRYESTLLIWSNKQWIARQAFPLLLGLAIQSSVKESTKTFCESANLPDYSKLVMQGFIKRVVAEIPDWPQMQTENNPVNETYKYDGGALLAFSNKPGFTPQFGFGCLTTVTMTNRNGEILWKKEFGYTTKELNENYPLPFLLYDTDIWKADNGKLLKEEMSYAANMTINDLIKHFKEK